MSDVRGLLVRATEALREAGVPFAAIGAAARNAWAPPRASTDLDFAVLLEAEDYPRVREALNRAGFIVESEVRTDPLDALPAVAVFVDPALSEPPRQIDLLIAGTAFERTAITRAVLREVANERVPVVTREDLIVYKLIAWRPRDRMDIEDVLATAAAAGASIDWEYIGAEAQIWELEDRLAQLPR